MRAQIEAINNANPILIKLIGEDRPTEEIRTTEVTSIFAWTFPCSKDLSVKALKGTTGLQARAIESCDPD